jgi:hypothetical protein
LCCTNRIQPGVAMIHTVYAVYHLSRKASGRTPASSTSYMLFAAAFDVSIIPFYAFSALITSSQYKLAQLGTSNSSWTTLLATGQTAMTKLIGTAFLCATVSAGLHLMSFGLSICLAVIFRKITRLPPDMNPLEENLTSRHKRNKSSMSVSTVSEKRLSAPLESKRNSGSPYEDLSRPPTIPFLHTRSNSTESFSTYHSTPPGSRDSRLDLPSRQYQLQSKSNSPSSSTSDLKRSSYRATPTSSKRSSYAEFPTSGNAERGSRDGKSLTEAWQAAEPFSASQRTRTSPRKAAYHPLHQRFDSDDDISLSTPHPHPLEANPPTPRLPAQRAPRKSALTEIGLNDINVDSGDLADGQNAYPQKELRGQENFKAKYYGELRAGTPPIMIGSGNVNGNGRQVSSGNDFMDKGAYRGPGRREVSGKIAEEGRGGSGVGGWGTRLRKISGL